jgi:cardiolipin synthase
VAKFRVLQLVLVYLLSGCAHLPDVAKKIEQTPVSGVVAPISTANGYLSEKQSKAILERLEKASDPTDIIQRFNAVMETVTESPLTKGNKVILLNDGPSTYAAMLRAIEGAKDHVNMETFIIDDDKAGQDFSNALLKKQREGVQISLIYDSRGSNATPTTFFKRLEEGGIQVLEFKSGNAPGQSELVHLDHRKILVVDGKIGITGGVNISDVYSSSLFRGRRFWEKEKEIQEGKNVNWRDTDVQIEGPAVEELQKMFMQTWATQNGPQLKQRNFFPKLEERGNALVRVIGNTPGDEHRVTFIAYVAAIEFAQRYVHLTNAYFVPDPQLLKALKDAAKRGLDVKIILPQITDSGWVRNASHYHYSELMEAGVKIYELPHYFLHAKTAVIDDVWSTVGSTNLDYLSMQHNDEVNALILSKEFAADMENSFAKDLTQSEKIDPRTWGDRKLSKRLVEWIAHLIKGIL